MSATANASDLRQVLQLWEESGDPRNPFANVLISPLFAAPSTLKFVRDELKDKRDSTIFFDSGGYFVQQGRISYEALYYKLLNYYTNRINHWADWYILPDHVPTSRDKPETVTAKVNDTITAARMFFNDMSSELHAKALPVVQGHTEQQVLDCIEMYADLGVDYIGFGSFGTCGASNQMNIVTDQSIRMLQILTVRAKEYGFNTHLFGVSTPPILYVFDRLGVSSFDSMAWMKAAGFGNVFLPLVRGYMVTYRTYDRTHIYQENFEYLRALTKHRCPFCEDFSDLVHNRMHRILHNLVCVMDTLDILSELSELSESWQAEGQQLRRSSSA
ncbi:MAG: hypothetical protein L0287_19655, partial [Anaerolineae bacterium]|nr:hypothetical protein [Anaerolineae bacterium]